MNVLTTEVKFEPTMVSSESRVATFAVRVSRLLSTDVTVLT